MNDNEKNVAVARLLYPNAHINGSWIHYDSDTRASMLPRYTEDLNAIVEAVLALGYEIQIDTGLQCLWLDVKGVGPHQAHKRFAENTPQAIAAALVDALLAAEGVE